VVAIGGRAVDWVAWTDETTLLVKFSDSPNLVKYTGVRVIDMQIEFTGTATEIPADQVTVSVKSLPAVPSK
jgi:hypothetical protein